jgi:DNA primase
VDLAQTLTGKEAIKSGNGRYRLRCPFHDDRHPSLILYPPGRGWWCPVCQKGGSDAVSFVAQLQHCTAVEALLFVEQIADTYPDAWGAM